MIALVVALVATVWVADGRRERAGDLGPLAAQPEGSPYPLTGPPERTHDRKHVAVGFAPGTSRAERAEAHRRNAKDVRGRIDQLGIEVIRIKDNDTPEKAAKRYRSDADVEFAEPNFAYHALVTPNDPFFPGNGSSPDLWGLHNTGDGGGWDDADIDAPEGWDAAGVASASPWPVADYAIGIVDTGVDGSHSDLLGRTITPCYRSLNGEGNLHTGCPDDHSHGTHVAGTAAAIGDNGRGVVGVAPNARIHACKALDSNGSGWMADVAACVTKLVDERATTGMNVMSMSLGGPATDTVRAAVDYASNNGVLVFAAAGNDGNSNISYPAGYESVVSVAATDRSDGRASFSNANADVELSAPGVSTISTVPGNGYQTKSGTSMSTPHAAATAALVSWKTGLTGEALREQLNLTADDLGQPGRDPIAGFGRVNLCRALGGPCTPSIPPPPPTPEPTPVPTWTTYDDSTGAAFYRGTWRDVDNANALGGSFHSSSTPGSYVTFYFRGVGFRWIGQRAPVAGITAVYLDGVKIARVDAYAPSRRWKQTLYERTDLPWGAHRIDLYVTSRNNDASTSTVTFVDAFGVYG